MAAPTIIEFDKAKPTANYQGWTPQKAYVRADQISAMEETPSSEGLRTLVHFGIVSVLVTDTLDEARAKWIEALDEDDALRSPAYAVEAAEKRGRARKEPETPPAP